jgi:N-ethylmaleimide reductase
MPGLLDSLKLGKMELAHRIVLSPMTRLRCAPGTEAPRELNAEYYSQRTSQGGLMISECAHITPSGRGYVRCVRGDLVTG